MNQNAHTTKSQLIGPNQLRCVIGYLGTLLPVMLVLGCIAFCDTGGIQRTVSHYYHTAMRDVFVGMLFAIGLGMLSYRGYDRRDVFASNLAAILAVGVALFPTDQDPDTSSLIGYVHLFFAAAFFCTLIYFAYFLFTKTGAGQTPTEQKKKRNIIYKCCSIIMALCIVLITVHYLLPEQISDSYVHLSPVFVLESIAVIAFGISWLTKGNAFLQDQA